MASQAYHDWVAAGKPKSYGRAVKAFADKLRAHGYTVYMDGDDRHLEHEPPEDHTFYSATGWPGTSPRWYCMAADVMPPANGQKSKITGQPLPSLQKLSAQLKKDKMDGVKGAQFVKYMNHEPEANYSGPCYHESWQPNHSRSSSSDRGHIHVSSRSDYATSSASDGYDLVARVMGDDMNEAQTDAWYASRVQAKDGTDYADTRNQLRAVAWQYKGGGLPEGLSTLNTLNAIYGFAKSTNDLVQIIATQDHVDEVALGNQIAQALAPAIVSLSLPMIVEEIAEAGAEALTPEAIREAVAEAVRLVLRDGVGTGPAPLAPAPPA